MGKYRCWVSLAVAAVWLLPMGFAQNSETYNPLPRHFPTKDRFAVELGISGGTGNLIYHNGPVISTAFVVPIYWGPSTYWNTDITIDPISTSLTSYITGNGTSAEPGFGETGEYNVITQYYESGPINITKSKLGSLGVIYDSTNPLPANGDVTDADIQAEVLAVTGSTPRSDTVYEVFIPDGYYSSDGHATSCGGPHLKYCAYHGNFSTSAGVDVKYASMPYPSCSGCQTGGFTDTQNLEHFVSHETREAVTDPDGTGWYDKRGYEADDKCAWSPTPFTDSSTGTNTDGTGLAYQYEWSNAVSGCVQSQ